MTNDVLNWTYQNVKLYVRDLTCDWHLLQLYQKNQILTDPSYIEMSYKLGGMLKEHNTRFCILSAFPKSKKGSLSYRLPLSYISLTYFAIPAPGKLIAGSEFLRQIILLSASLGFYRHFSQTVPVPAYPARKFLIHQFR